MTTGSSCGTDHTSARIVAVGSAAWRRRPHQRRVVVGAVDHINVVWSLAPPTTSAWCGVVVGAADHISVVWSLAPPTTSGPAWRGRWRRQPHQHGVVVGRRVLECGRWLEGLNRPTIPR